MIFVLRVLHHNELELTASKASLEYMKGAVDELTNSRNERLRAREILLMKHKKIEDFEKLAVSSLYTALVNFIFLFVLFENIGEREKEKRRTSVDIFGEKEVPPPCQTVYFLLPPPLPSCAGGQ